VKLKAPFPWFGGKSRAAAIVWDRFGDCPNYVEPFAGSLAVLLGRPTPGRIETVNDLDCFLSNFWRAVAADPEAVAQHADWPVNEADLHARHLWLVDRVAFRESIRADPGFYDARIAGWWVWGLCQWIGSGWCTAPEWSGRSNAGRAGRGVHAKRPRLAAGGRGVSRQIPCLSGDSGAAGRGIHASGLTRKIPDLGGAHGNAGRGVHASGVDASQSGVLAWFIALQDRLRHVRVCCGDWARVLGPAPTTCIGVTGVLLDPPYADTAGRDPNLYAHDSLTVAHDVRAWAVAHGEDPKLRIALCGYEGEHEMPESWECVAWKAHGGFSGQRKGTANVNAGRERIWFSPHCLRLQPGLFDAVAAK
jgi:DNA adenine methylase